MKTIECKLFSISAYQLPDGKWMANYGRSDALTTINGITRATWPIEQPCSKQEDAIDQAYIAINGLHPD